MRAKLEVIRQAIGALGPGGGQAVAHALPRQGPDQPIVQGVEEGKGGDLGRGLGGVEPDGHNRDRPGDHQRPSRLGLGAEALAPPHQEHGHREQEGKRGPWRHVPLSHAGSCHQIASMEKHASSWILWLHEKLSLQRYEGETASPCRGESRSQGPHAWSCPKTWAAVTIASRAGGAQREKRYETEEERTRERRLLPAGDETRVRSCGLPTKRARARRERSTGGAEESEGDVDGIGELLYAR